MASIYERDGLHLDMSSSQEAGALLAFLFGQRPDLQALASLAGSLGVVPLLDFGSASRGTPLFDYEG